MIYSMTGYGKASIEIAGKKVTAEIKSLNSKLMDISTRISNGYRTKEIEIRNELSGRIKRGKVDFSLYVESSVAETTTQINLPLIESYYWQIKAISEKLHIPVPEDWFQTLMRMPDITKTESHSELSEEEWEDVKALIHKAIDEFNAFREQEGKSLQKVFETKIGNIRKLSEEINKYEAERIEKIKTRLRDNLAAIGEVDYDKNRFEQELIFYIEKLDVNEEKVRLKNHLDYFLETMEHEKSPGKKLGFIAQEIGREINTLGSKSNHSEMQKLVVLMKDELEQVKEQVLNVL